jgi:hypothetical protein
MADRNNRNPDFLQLAQNLILEGGEFTKAREAQVRSLMKLAELAAELNAAAPKKHGGIAYSSPEERNAFLAYLRTGRGESRDMTAGGGAYPGSTGSPLVPVGFERSVIEAEKLVDQLVDPTLISYLRTERGSAHGLPLDTDLSPAHTVAENAPDSTVDPLMGLLALGAIVEYLDKREDARGKTKKR